LKTLLLEDLEFVRYTTRTSQNSGLDYIPMSASTQAGYAVRIEDNGRDTSVSLSKLKRLGARTEPKSPYGPANYNPGAVPYDDDAGAIFRNLGNMRLPMAREAHDSDKPETFEANLRFITYSLSFITRILRLLTTPSVLMSTLSRASSRARKIARGTIRSPAWNASRVPPRMRLSWRCGSQVTGEVPEGGRMTMGMRVWKTSIWEEAAAGIWRELVLALP
jgi:hypothetical protein